MADAMTANQTFEHLSGPHPGISLPDGHRVYAVGDIHGRRDLLDEMDAMIVADSMIEPPDAVTVVYLGDYIDKGPDSAAVIDCLAGPHPGGFETVCLIGNHDHFMVRFLAGDENLDHWLSNGGREALASYGVPWALGPDRALAELRAALPPEHRAFLDGLRLSHRIGNVVFAHAGIDPRRPLNAQTPKDLMWIRDPFLDWPAPMDVVIVHGHTPRPTPEVAHHRVGVDTLAWQSGTLTAAVLEKGTVRFLST